STDFPDPLAPSIATSSGRARSVRSRRASATTTFALSRRSGLGRSIRRPLSNGIAQRTRERSGTLNPAPLAGPPVSVLGHSAGAAAGPAGHAARARYGYPKGTPPLDVSFCLGDVAVELDGPERTGDDVIQLALGQHRTSQAAARGSLFRIYFFVF